MLQNNAIICTALWLSGQTFWECDLGRHMQYTALWASCFNPPVLGPCNLFVSQIFFSYEVLFACFSVFHILFAAL